MSLASHQCKSCSRFFTPTGLNSHVWQTRNDNCRRWYSERSPQVNERLPQEFEGDLYGNDYQKHDFPGFDDAPHVFTHSSDDEYDAVVYDEDGWEPEQVHQPIDARDIPPSVLVDPVPSNRQGSYNRLSKKPTIRLFNDRPGRNAGAPLIGVNKTSYETYQDALLKDDAVPNVWAPFASKIDWEIARWAKLRGPSSTALSELLRVEGVRSIHSSH
jgi:hypothetical protein